MGHQTGDVLIKQVVQKLKKCIKREDIIARWGDGEFTLLLSKIHDRDEVSAIANRILEDFKTPININNQPTPVALNIGIATYPDCGKNAETLLKNADAALSQSQQVSRHNYQYYDPNFSSQALELLTVENLLYSALEKNEFILYYQPIITRISITIFLD